MIKKSNLILLAIVMPVSVGAIELTDYTDPESVSEESYLTGRLSLNSGNQDQTSFDGTALGYYETSHSTRPFVWNLKSNGQIDLHRGQNEGDSNQRGYEVGVQSDANRYFHNSNLLSFGSLDLGQRRLFGNDSDDDPYAKVGVGIGYGRIINATPLADAIRVVAALKEIGVINHELDDSTYLKLGKQIASGGGIEDIEEMLLQAGVLNNNTLGTVGAVKMRSALDETRISVRKYGWLAKAGVGYIASNYDGSDSDPSLDASFEYAHPFSTSFQFDNLAEYSTILDEDIVHRLENRMSATYEMSGQVDWENVWSLNLISPTEDGAKDTLTNQLSSILHYYVSNGVSADLSVSLTDVEDDIDGNDNDDLESGVFMGVTYRLK